MKFNIESYLIEEGQDTIEYNKEHLEALKKAGFDKIYEQSEKQDEPTTIPFKCLSNKESKLISGFYDTHSQPKEFKNYVPLQVASLLALCKDKDYFEKVEIRSDVASNNTLMSEFTAIGYTSEGKYIIARWSVAPLTSMEDLVIKATVKIKKKLVDKITDEMADKQRDLNNIDSLITKYLKGSYISYFF